MPLYSSYKALIIGIGEYKDPQHKLPYARSDAEAIARVLGEEFGFNQIWTLYDQEATLQNITRYFQKDLLESGRDDGLLIFFAGHGLTKTSAIGDEMGYLMPHDGDAENNSKNISLIVIREEYLRNIPAKHVFMVIDACYGGLVLRDVAAVRREAGLTERVLAEWTRQDRPMRQVLSAGGKDQKVLDGGLYGHSIFTGRFIEALHETDPYHLYIMADDVCGKVRRLVAADASTRGHSQTPQFGYLLGSEGTFVFKRSVQTPPPPPGKEEWEDKKKPPVIKKIESREKDYISITSDGRFKKTLEGVVIDTKKKLQWFVGPDKDTDWEKAKRWVENLSVAGGNWRMPTRDELSELYKKGRGERNMDPIFNTQGWYIWSGEVKDSAAVWFFNFIDGNENWSKPGFFMSKRAFGVRSL